MYKILIFLTKRQGNKIELESIMKRSLILTLLIFAQTACTEEFSPNGTTLYRLWFTSNPKRIFEKCEKYETRSYEAVLKFIGKVKRNEIDELNMKDVFSVTKESYFKKLDDKKSIKISRYRVIKESKNSILMQKYDNSDSYNIFNSKEDCDKSKAALIIKGF